MRTEDPARGDGEQEVGDFDAEEDVGVEHDALRFHGSVVEAEFLALARQLVERFTRLGVGAVTVRENIC